MGYSSQNKVEFENHSGGKTKEESPIDIDINDTTLSIKLIKDTHATVIVTGSDGIILNKDLNYRTNSNLDMNINPTDDGEYNVTVINNNNGETYEGEFSVQK